MKQQQNFFDSKTIAAIVVVFLMFWAWQAYMTRKYPDLYAKKDTQVEVSKDGAQVPTVPETPSRTDTPPEASSSVAITPPDEKEQLIRFENKEVSFDVSSYGMSLKNYELKNFKDREGKVVSFGPEGLLETRLLGRPEPLVFKIDRVNEAQLVGRARIGSMEIVKTIEINTGSYSLRYKVSVNNPDDRFIGLTTVLPDEATSPPKGGLSFLSHADIEEMFILNKDSEERVHFGSDDVEKSWTNVQVASIGSQYFTQAVVDKSDVMPEVKGTLKRANNSARLLMNYSLINKGSAFDISYTAFVGPKSFQLLNQTDEKLSQVIDFGFFNWIARQILQMLKFFYSLFGNWGVAIIGLTILVRILVLPFNIMSYKSMKAMQVIQPQLKAIKEKYKNDMQKQQAETMALMREHKVNPMGGCLPVLLQFPIFIALYQVLGHSIELYQAPFGLWIHDLSLKDPYYVLPVLMGLTMYFQQKIMPNPGMDPVQANILKFMPLMFAAFMLSVPSGLTLYIFVSSAFAVVQQMYFMKHGQKAES